MTRLVRVAGVAACAAMLMAADCGHTTQLVHEYRLSACPASDYVLPGSIAGADGRSLDVYEPEQAPFCPVFRLYELSRGNRGAAYGVRFVRGETCRFELAWGYMRGGLFAEGERDPREEERMSALADVAASLLIEDVGIASDSALTHLLWDGVAQDAWCEAALAGEEWAADGDET